MKDIYIPKRESTSLKIDMCRFKGRYPIKSMDSAVHSNKYLCGALSVLCGELRRHSLPYPWREE